MSFGYWSQYQFNSALSDLEATIIANTLLVSPSLEKDTKLASTSLEMTLAADMLTASSSFEKKTELISTSTDLKLSFTFPKKDDKVYIGCTYPISWQSSTTINLLGTVLVDAGAREPIDPIASGLAKESVIETDSQNLNWKVGFVWPGAYYIKVLKINGADVEIRSKVFTINNMPKGINTDEREKICKKW